MGQASHSRKKEGRKSKKERRFGNKKQGKTALVVEGAIMQVMES